MHRCLTLFAAAMLPLSIVACTGEQPPGARTDQPGVMNVVANGMSFEAPDTVPAGWVTIRFDNKSPVAHFAVVERLPDGVDAARQQKEVAPVFQAGMDLLSTGQSDSAMAAFGALPEWYPQVVFMGGPGLTGPGATSQSTIRLEPGTYLLECYVKTGGTFHSFSRDTSAWGMVHQFVVTEPASAAAEPEADMTLTVSAERGIEVQGTPTAGTRTVAVRFADQKAHENFVGHDVHLLKLAPNTDLDSVAVWMNWTSDAGLQTPAPVTFLGGLNEMPAGSIGYVTATFEPGKYAWIAEVPNPGSKHMLVPFTVE